MSLPRLPNVKKPCKDCPFRKDSLKGWLGEERMRGILFEQSFVCHKNTKLQCAGHMLLLRDFNQFYRLAGVFKFDLHLSGRELVFDTIDECIEHHS